MVLAALAAGFRLRLGGGVALRLRSRRSLRLRFTSSARRPQTEAGLDFIYCEATPIHLALISAVFITDSLKMLKTP